jgi:aldehyde dehydrogenase
MEANAELIRSVVADVLTRIGNNSGAATAAPAPTSAPQRAAASYGKRPGVFENPDDAIQATGDAVQRLRSKGYAGRREVVRIVKELCTAKAEEWGKLEFAETKIGRLEHKIAKLQGIQAIPGVEWLSPLGMSGDHGISLEENAPFGVIAAITPVTHSIPTLSANIVNMVAAGNGVVINAHPGGAKCAAEAVATYNRLFADQLGLENLVTIVETPSIESFNQIVQSDGIDLLCVTGGPAVVNAAMRSGKRSICAGPGNPPVVVDETANLSNAARDITIGAAFDNNLLCIGEKQIFVVDAVFDEFMAQMARHGGYQLNREQLRRLAGEAFSDSKDAGGCSQKVLNRDFIGVDASVLGKAAGVNAPDNTLVLFAEAPFTCPFVQKEQMMPMLPVVRVADVDEAIAKAKESEHGYKHSALMHSQHIGNLTKMGQEMDCTLFVKNGPCLAGLGNGGEGYGSFSVATTTGEGITTPDTFTRKRRCVMVNNLNIVT